MDNQVSLILAGIWLIIAFGDSKNRETFAERCWNLLVTPAKLQGYPKELGTNLQKFLTTFPSQVLDVCFKNTASMFVKRQWKLLGQFIFLIFLALFLLSDVIAIYNGEAVLGIPVENLPENIAILLGQFGLAVTIGTFISLVTGGVVFFECLASSRSKQDSLSEKNSASSSAEGVISFSDFGSYPKLLRKVVTVLALILLISSLFTGVIIGAATLKGQMAVPTWLEDLAKISVNVLVRFNVLLATIIIPIEGVKGLLTIVLFGLVLITSCLAVFIALLYISAMVFWIVIDFLLRLILWVAAVMTFIIFTPLDRVLKTGNVFVGLVDRILNRFFPLGSRVSPRIPSNPADVEASASIDQIT